MRSPTVKTLCKHFPNLERKDARLIKRLCRLADSRDRLEDLIDTHPQLTLTRDYARSCYHSPWDSAMWRRTMILHAVDRLLGTFGVEVLDRRENSTSPEYEYLNTGDPYNTTLVYKRSTDNLFIGAWGDIAERWA